MTVGPSHRTPRRFLLDGVFDWRITNEVFEDAMARLGSDAGWYGLRAGGRAAPITPLGRRLLGLHLFTITPKDR